MGKHFWQCYLGHLHVNFICNFQKSIQIEKVENYIHQRLCEHCYSTDPQKMRPHEYVCVYSTVYVSIIV